MYSPPRHAHATTIRSLSPFLLLAATALALLVLVIQPNADAAAGPTPGIGIKRWGSTYSTASGYDRYAYVNVAPGDAAAAGSLPTKSLVYMSGTSVQTSWSTGVSYQEAQANNWLLKDASGQYLMNVGYGAYVGDFGNAAYQQRFVDNVASLLSRNGNEGVFIDDVIASPEGLTGGKYPAKYPTQQAWEDAQVSFVKTVGEALRARGYYVLIQAIKFISGNPGSNDGSLNAQFWGRLAQYASGIQSEYWMQDPNSVTRLRASGSEWYQQWDAWANLVNVAQNGGADFFAMMYGGSSNVDIMRYGKASFLLMWDGSGGAFTYDPSSGDPWNPEWTTDVGQPSGSRYQVGAGWRREYTNGTVILNPSTSASQTFALGGTYRRADGTSVTSVTLQPTTALVLSKDSGSTTTTPPPPPPPTEPPPPSSAAPTSSAYLSDLGWASATNGWGPVEKDRANGENAAGDGQGLTLNGTTYAKGLGVHSSSDVRYNLGGNCSKFTASVGVDDEVGANGSVAFQVYAGSTKVFDSGVMTGTSATKPVDVSLAGASELRLVVGNGGDNINYDHGDWAGARVECSSSTTTPPPTSPPPPTTTPSSAYLSDLSWTSATNGWGPVEKDRANGENASGDGGTLTLNGTTYAKGLGVHAPSDVRFNLGGTCSRFTASVGVDDEVGTNGSVGFQVYADSNKVFDSGVMTGASATKPVDVSVAGASELRLVVGYGGDNVNYDHGDWAAARIECGSSTTTPPPTSPPPPAAPVNSAVPTISGTAQAGLSLSASTGTWSNSPTGYAYQWRRCDTAGASCTSVAGATGAQYALSTTDVGSTLRVAVTATNAGGSTSATSSPSGVVAPAPTPPQPPSGAAPANTGLPVISGTAEEGKGLSAGTGTWINAPTGYSFQWRRCDSSGGSCASIGGATATQYTLGSQDVGRTLRVLVTALNGSGQSTATSAASAVVAPKPAPPPPPGNVKPPELSGPTGVGKRLRTSDGTWTNAPTRMTYQWKRCESSLSTCETIAGATDSSYALNPGDVGYQIVVVVTAWNAGGTCSAASGLSTSVRVRLGAGMN